MEQHYSNRPTAQGQQQQQHVYSTSAYNVYPSQPPYLSGAYQASAQHQQITYQQAPNQYSRQGAPTNTHTTGMQQRRSGNVTSSNGGGVNRGGMLHQSGGPAMGAVHHQQISASGNGVGDAPYAVSSGGAPMHPIASLAHHHRSMPSQDMPLRMVVDAKYVGAIIGQGGANIRDITKESKARCVVDVQRPIRDPSGNPEKVISILGQPENCTRACVKILEVVRKEMEKDKTAQHHPEVSLKIRAHNQLVGRLIGKGGATIKKIMEETGAVVFVSNEPAPSRDVMGMLPQYGGPPSLYAADMAMHSERTITVKAPDINTVSLAEQKIMKKLRQSYEADLSSRILYPGASGMIPLMTPLGGSDAVAYIGAAGNVPASHLSRATANAAAAAAAAASQQTRTVRMWVPNNMVGALIGAKGVHIRNVMRMTGAHVRIEGGGTSNMDNREKPAEKENKDAAAGDSGKVAEDATEDSPRPLIENSEDADKEKTEKEKKEESVDKAQTSAKSGEKDKEKDLHADERLVTITGNEPQQYKAQFWIYQRVAEQSYHYLDEVRLCTEISVPSKLVGRIIGKGGQNVRELQRITGAQVKIPDDAGEDESQETTTMRVLGNFQASQMVQARLAQLIHDFAHRLTLWSANGQPSGAQGGSPISQERVSSGGQGQASGTQRS